MYTFHTSSWSNLTRDQFHAILRLRISVFVVEQNCPYPELDAKDLSSIHVYALKNDENLVLGDSAVACVRICAPGVSYPEPSIGRVATRPDCRKTGLGIEVMKRSIDVCESAFPGQGIRISAQCYLEKFYSDLGFSPIGETYLEDNIPHIQMFRPSAS